MQVKVSQGCFVGRLFIKAPSLVMYSMLPHGIELLMTMYQPHRPGRLPYGSIQPRPVENERVLKGRRREIFSFKTNSPERRK
jgi:hypothetical protein